VLFETEGWAVALAGAIRESVAPDFSPDLAYEAWRQKEGRRFAEFIEQDLARVSPSDREVLSRLMWGAAIEPQRGARLEGLGCSPHRRTSLFRRRCRVMRWRFFYR
jgi:hypothetical protein